MFVAPAVAEAEGIVDRLTVVENASSEHRLVEVRSPDSATFEIAVPKEQIPHGGSSWGFRAYLELFPEQELSVAVLCNVDEASPYELAGKVSELFLAKNDSGAEPVQSEATESPAPEVKPEEETGDQPDLAIYRGTYTCDELEVTHEVIVEGGRLAIRVKTRRGEWPRIDFDPVNDGTFTGDGYELVFERDAHGGIRGFTLSTERARNFRFTRR